MAQPNEGTVADNASLADDRAYRAVHHIGITVENLDRSLAFWESLLGKPARFRRVGDAPYLGRIVNFPGVRIEFGWIDLPGGVGLELLQYLDRDDGPITGLTSQPGSVHVCLTVDDVQMQWSRALGLGARPISAAPVEIVAGPNAGAFASYLRSPEGVVIELFQPAPGVVR